MAKAGFSFLLFHVTPSWGPSSVCLRSSGSGIPFNSKHPPQKKYFLNTGLCPPGTEASTPDPAPEGSQSPACSV